MEVLIAIVIVSMALLPILTSFMGETRHAAFNERHATAQAIAENEFAFLNRLDFRQLLERLEGKESGGDTALALLVDELSRKETGSPAEKKLLRLLSSYEVSLDVEKRSDALAVVTVTVSWKKDGRKYRYVQRRIFTDHALGFEPAGFGGRM